MQCRGASGRWGAACVLLLATIHGVEAASNYVSRPAGFVRYAVPGTNQVLASMPLAPFNASLEVLFAGQLTGGVDTNGSDLLLKFDPALQQYVTFWRTNNGPWCQAPQVMATTNTLRTGEGLWLKNRRGVQEVFLFGAVSLAATQTLTLVGGLNLFGYPYDSALALNGSDFKNDGALGSTNMNLADQVIEGLTSNRFWFFKQAGHTNDNKWMTSSGAVAGASLTIGAGSWYQRLSSNALVWTEGRPFADPFAVGAGAPQITAMTLGSSKTSVTLSISCSGIAGETLEVFYKDMASNAVFSTSNGWLLAASNLLTTSQTVRSWTDSGGGGRPAVTAAYHRVYLIGRQDIDSDNDSISDARELFVIGSSPTNVDSDADGLSDGLEVFTYGTSATNRDTDADAMSDGSEVYWSLQPRTNSAFAKPPWAETFEARTDGALNGQNGWYASATNSVLVQTSSVFAGARALRMGATGAPVVAGHYFGAVTATNVWIDSYLKPVPGELPDITQFSNRPTAVVAPGLDGRIYGYDGLLSAWTAATNAAATTGQWVRATVKLNYRTRTWSLNLDGKLALAGLGFRDANVSEFTRAQWQGGMRGDTYVDNVNVVTNEPAALDDDADGMPNTWERLYGLNPNNPVDASADNDGDRVSNLAEYQGGLSPIKTDTDGDRVLDGVEVYWGLGGVASNAYQMLPWLTGFETNQGYAIGNLSSQDHWLVRQGAAAVQTNRIAAGQQAAQIVGATTGVPVLAEHFFAGTNGMTIWTDMKVQLVPGPLPAIASNSYLAAVIAVDENRKLAGFNGSSGTWVVAAGGPDIHSQTWQRITVKEVFTNRTWTLYLDGKPVLTNLVFADQLVDRMNRLAVQGAIGEHSFLDDVVVTNKVPPHIDDDCDGRPNVAEDVNGNGVVDAGESNPFNPDTDNDGMDDGAELAWGYSATVSNAFTRLPWTAGFEPAEGYTNGVLNNQKGWLASTSAVVQSQVNYSGTNAVRLVSMSSTNAAATRFVGARGITQAWVEVYAFLKPGRLPLLGELGGAHGVVASVDEAGLLCGFHGGRREWVASSYCIDTGRWERLTVLVDYSAKAWSLYAGSRRILQNLPFLDSNVRWLSRLQVLMVPNPGVPSQVHVDGFTVSVSEPAGLDNDGDGAPNSWELLFGFDPENAADGAADADGDGLGNTDEYSAGTNPFSTDSDHDGVCDRTEWLDLGTSATSNDLSTVLVASIPGAAARVELGSWTNLGSSIYALSRRGQLSYDLDLPSSGKCLVTVTVSAHDPREQANAFDVLSYCNGEYLKRSAVPVHSASSGVFDVSLPYLVTGRHQFALFWDNGTDYKSLQIDSLVVKKVVSVDADLNGRDDWLDAYVDRSYSIDSPSQSPVSPACVEGKGRFLTMALLSPSNQAAAGVSNRWFANVPLSQTGTTAIAVRFENGLVTRTGAITWVAVDIAQATGLVLRAGDTLKMASGSSCSSGGAATVYLNGGLLWAGLPGTPFYRSFTTAGTYAVSSVKSCGGVVQSNSFTIRVLGDSFGDDPICWQGKTRSWSCSNLSSSCALQFDRDISLAETGLSPRVFALRLDVPESRFIVARATAGGPILAVAQVRPMRLYSTASTSVRILQTYPNGDELIEMPMVMWPLYANVTVKLNIIASGVVFEGGGLDLAITGSELDALGMKNVHFIRAAGMQTSICHILKAYQGEVLMGRR